MKPVRALIKEEFNESNLFCFSQIHFFFAYWDVNEIPAVTTDTNVNLSRERLPQKEASCSKSHPSLTGTQTGVPQGSSVYYLCFAHCARAQLPVKQ